MVGQVWMVGRCGWWGGVDGGEVWMVGRWGWWEGGWWGGVDGGGGMDGGGGVDGGEVWMVGGVMVGGEGGMFT